MPERKLQMKTTRFEMDGKQVTVGALRRYMNRRAVPLLDSLGLVRAVNSEYGTNLKLMNPRVADYMLDSILLARDVGEAFPSPVDAIIAYERGYEAPGFRLDTEIVYTPPFEQRVILPTGGYKGERGIALVVLDLTADDIKKDGKDIRIDVSEDRLVVVPAFPFKNGWYMPHDKTSVPHGEDVGVSSGGRYLRRYTDSTYVNLLVRGCGGLYGYSRHNVDARYGSASEFGVVVEVPEKDLVKIDAW